MIISREARPQLLTGKVVAAVPLEDCGWMRRHLTGAAAMEKIRSPRWAALRR